MFYKLMTTDFQKRIQIVRVCLPNRSTGLHPARQQAIFLSWA
jgi:hypothetical protein